MMKPGDPTRKRIGFILAGLLLLGLLAALASQLPDGLEWTLARLGIAPGDGPAGAAPLAGYAWPWKMPGWLQNVLSAMAGGLAVWLLLRLATIRKRP